jgi:hypothetical protein
MYRAEIEAQDDRRKGSIYAAEQMLELRDTTSARAYANTASTALETAYCLRNQLSLRVPFYEGKARCATAVGSQS